jgi:hypothetical protein
MRQGCPFKKFHSVQSRPVPSQQSTSYATALALHGIVRHLLWPLNPVLEWIPKIETFNLILSVLSQWICFGSRESDWSQPRRGFTGFHGVRHRFNPNRHFKLRIGSFLYLPSSIIRDSAVVIVHTTSEFVMGVFHNVSLGFIAVVDEIQCLRPWFEDSSLFFLSEILSFNGYLDPLVPSFYIFLLFLS